MLSLVILNLTMQQQDNEFPIDQIQSGTPAASGPPNNGLAGGTTFQPQADPQATQAPTPTPTPDWQQTASTDVAELYQAPETPAAPNPNPIPAPTPENPAVNGGTGLVVPGSEPSQAPAVMQQDFSQANQIGTPSSAPQPLSPDSTQPAGPTPMQTPQEPIVPMPESAPSPAPASVDTSALAAAPMLAAEPAGPMPPNPLMAEPGPVPMPAPMPGLPGSDQLGSAAVGMDQSSMQLGTNTMNPDMAGVDPLAVNAEGMGAYGPPPKSKKKLLFIIGGAILGIAIIGIVIFVITRSSARKPAQNLNPTTTTTPTEQTEPTPTPSSGPATPPQGYITIEKQCYTFALYDPNTVPADQACSFKDATFGKLNTSKISVISTTDAYKNLDEFVGTIKPTLTVTSEESIKLDNFDAKQLIYKASDGKTYSRVLTLIVGKSYQQDGNAVTGIDVTTSYQDDFDKTVTKNVLDTWRWK